MTINSTPTDTNLHRCVDDFRNRFGQSPEVLAHAPGRVNLLGEHVDYNEGVVLPFAVAQNVLVAAAHTNDNCLTAWSVALGESCIANITDLEHPETRSWADYLLGMVAGLRGFGATPPGALLWIGGDLPPGSGMSSSAALCIACGNALAALAGVDVQPLQLAQIAQAAERDFAGTPCGIMDPYTACFGKAGHALRLDCRQIRHDYVPFAPDDHVFLAMPSGVKHALADGAYDARVHACREAVATIATDFPHVTALRDVSPERLRCCRDRLKPAVYKRALHVVTEMERVEQAYHALRTANWPRLGNLLWQTQDSLRDNYDVSCPEIDTLIALLRRENGVLGARMVGGGFGGIVLALVECGKADAIRQRVHTDYYAISGLNEHITSVWPAHGAGVMRVNDRR